METDRRQFPRTAMERIAYIGIEPDNGGIVLNISDGGLCFHSIAPVKPGKKIRFSTKDHNRLVEADGEMVWTDESGTAGGLRFQTVPAELGDQLRRWVMIPDVSSAAANSSVRGVSLRRAIEKVRAIQVRVRLSGYARGVLTGMLFSALLATGFILHAYRGRLGQALIHLGQSISGQSQIPLNAARATVSEHLNPVPTTASLASVREPNQKLSVKSGPDPKIPPTEINRRAITPITVRSNPVATTRTSLVPPAITMPVIAAGPHLPPSETIPRLAPGNSSRFLSEESGSANIGPPPQMYFEVGKFKREVTAEDERQKLSRLGLPASVVEKSRLWSSSYHILVGPYVNESNAAAAGHTLVSSGYKPRPYERGSRSFTFGSKLVVDQTPVPTGECEIKWESYVSNAVVKILQNSDLVTTLNGRWEKREAKFDKDAIVYERHLGGSRNLIEIHFAGMDRALVFGKAS